MDSHVLVSQRSGPQDLEQSTEYRWGDFVPAFQQMATNGIAGNKLETPSVKAGLVNIALFLAQCMQETIQYNACDENNWSLNLGVSNYPLTAACGQAGQDYSQYKCSEADKEMECPIDPDMAIQASTYASWGGAPPPLFCAPTSITGEALGRWDFSGECGPAGYKTIPAFPEPYISDAVFGTETCNAYEGQFAGKFTFSGCNPTQGCPNTDNVDTAGGKIHYNVEGCCWWGRGVIQTTGPCNVGKLNYYLAGKKYVNGKANQWNQDAPYANLNFCENPNVICDGPKELRWISGMFYWLNDVQAYQNSNYQWNFSNILAQDANAIFESPSSNTAKSLVDATSGLVNRGCPASSCPGAGNVHALNERFDNFQKAMAALKHIYDPVMYPKPAGTPAPLSAGAWYKPAVMCQTCGTGTCAIRWSKNGAVSCAGWVNSKSSCEAASRVAAVWCESDSSPVAPSPVAPTPTEPSPVAPSPISPTPMPSTPVAPVPTTPVPIAPTPTLLNPPTEAVECSNCIGISSGPCKQSNGVCWAYSDASTRTCPPSTFPCSDTSPSSVPTLVPVAATPSPMAPLAPVIPPKKSLPDDLSKDESKLFNAGFELERGGLKRRLRRQHR
jgi:hypothetical protein